MFNVVTGFWQILNVVFLIGVIFGIPYYLIQSFKSQKRMEKKLDEIVEYIKK